MDITNADRNHLRGLLDSTHRAALISEHELKRSRERVALKVTAITAGTHMAQEFNNSNRFYGMTDEEWARYEAKARRLTVPPPAPVDPKPYVVLTRRYLKNGDCRKGRHTFATEAAQMRFIRTTTAAVTYTN